MSAPDIAIEIREPGWLRATQDPEGICVRAALASLDEETLNGLEPGRLEISVLLADDALVQTLNRDYRDKDQPTNVLSFAALDADAPLPPDGPILLGDIVVALETVEKEAENEKISVEWRLSHMIVHGVLHLLGYDHMEEEDAQAMESLEIGILARIGVANPYDATEAE